MKEWGGDEIKTLNRKSTALIDANKILKVQRERANKAETKFSYPEIKGIINKGVKIYRDGREFIG